VSGKTHPYSLTENVPVGTSYEDGKANGTVVGSVLLYTPLPSGQFAHKGCYVYGNAHPCARYGKTTPVNVPVNPPTTPATYYQTTRRYFYPGPAASAGTADLQNCPFVRPVTVSLAYIQGAFGYRTYVTKTTCATDIHLDMIGRSFVVPTYQVAFYRRTDQYYMQNVPQYPNNGRVQDWGPVSGKKYGPPVASGSPATNGQWRITAQSVTGIRDNDGVDLLKIVRTFQRVPYVFPNCIWNPQMYPIWTADWT
jgi:hypothetical protein